MSYSPLLLEHFHHPQYAGSLLSGPNVLREQSIETTGDRVALTLLIQNNHIQDIRYQVHGCPAMIASMSWLATQLIHQDYTYAQQLSAEQIVSALSLPPHKHRCALIAQTVLQKVLSAWYNPASI